MCLRNLNHEQSSETNPSSCEVFASALGVESERDNMRRLHEIALLAIKQFPLPTQIDTDAKDESKPDIITVREAISTLSSIEFRKVREPYNLSKQVELNSYSCLTFSIAAVKILAELDIPLTDIQAFNTGFHIGILFKLDPNDIYVYDALPNDDGTYFNIYKAQAEAAKRRSVQTFYDEQGVHDLEYDKFCQLFAGLPIGYSHHNGMATSDILQGITAEAALLIGMDYYDKNKYSIALQWFEISKLYNAANTLIDEKIEYAQIAIELAANAARIKFPSVNY